MPYCQQLSEKQRQAHWALVMLRRHLTLSYACSCTNHRDWSSSLLACDVVGTRFKLACRLAPSWWNDRSIWKSASSNWSKSWSPSLSLCSQRVIRSCAKRYGKSWLSIRAWLNFRAVPSLGYREACWKVRADRCSSTLHCKSWSHESLSWPSQAQLCQISRPRVLWALWQCLGLKTQIKFG